MIFVLHGQYRIRMTGENGFAQIIIFFSNILEGWTSKLNTFAYNVGKISEAEWQSFYNQSEEWLETVQKAINVVGKVTKEHDDAVDSKRQNQPKLM